ncbi:MAG: hypothetical protein ACO1Q7_09490 [Gemmatimonas sp.]
MQRFSRNAFARTAALAAVSFLAACSADSPAPLAPELQRSNALNTTAVTGSGQLVSDLVSGLVPAKALRRTTPVATQITRSVKITKAIGGAIDIPETGLRIEIPAGAIPRDTMTITVTALAGRSVAYDFQPHGTTFLKPLAFRQSLTKTTWFQAILKPTLSGGYFANTAQVDPTTGIALLNEVLPLTILNNEARFNIFHFSGYMVSGGRQSSYDSQEMF